MNQLKNLVILSIINIIVVFVLIYTMLNYMFDSKDLLLNWVCVLVVFIVIAFANLLLSSMIFKHHVENNRVLLFPPTSFFILLFIGINYIIGNIKWVRSIEYSYIGRYYNNNNKIYFYLFTPFHVRRLDWNHYRGESAKEIIDIKSSLLKEHYNYLNRKSTVKSNFKRWDGALDEESKRMNTIDKIIK